jgi:hypothetical protein
MKNYLKSIAVVLVLISNGVFFAQTKATSIPLNEKSLLWKFQEMDYLNLLIYMARFI